MIGKAAITRGKVNSRYILTSLTGKEEWIDGDESYLTGQALYEDIYCARGGMENRIKEQQMEMFADRSSTAHFTSNQLRLYFSIFAYMLVRDLRADALVGTRHARASAGQIRLHLFKIAAQLTVSVRRVHIRLASACPSARGFAIAHAKLQMLSV